MSPGVIFGPEDGMTLNGPQRLSTQVVFSRFPKPVVSAWDSLGCLAATLTQ
jgi:hypothetical protein